MLNNKKSHFYLVTLMAKKPSQESKLKVLIRRYIIKIGELGDDLTKKNPRLEFGFLFFHPKGLTKQSNGKIIYHGRSFQANKPKKENFLVISHKTTLDLKHKKIVDTSENKRNKLYNDLKKIFLLKNVEYNLNLQEHSYIISNRIYPEKEGNISMENFYNTLRNIFHSDIYAIIIINEQLSGKVDLNGKEFNSPLYI